MDAPNFELPGEDVLTTTSSGLRFQHVTEGSGKQPGPTDNVEVHYAGWLTDGTPFDSSYGRGSTTSFPLNGVIAGWTEGLQLMKEGGATRFIIPADLAYGPRAVGNVIKPNSTLVFYVHLIKVG